MLWQLWVNSDLMWNFCFLLGNAAAETVVMMKTAYKEYSLGKTQAYEWCSSFQNGDLTVDDKPRSGQPSRTVIRGKNGQKCSKNVWSCAWRPTKDYWGTESVAQNLLEFKSTNSNRRFRDGLSIMTMHLLMQQFRYLISYQKWRDSLTPRPLLTWSCSIWLFLFLWMKRDMKGLRFDKVE